MFEGWFRIGACSKKLRGIMIPKRVASTRLRFRAAFAASIILASVPVSTSLLDHLTVQNPASHVAGRKFDRLNLLQCIRMDSAAKSMFGLTAENTCQDAIFALTIDGDNDIPNTNRLLFLPVVNRTLPLICRNGKR